MIGIDKTRLYAGNFPAGSSKGGHPICNSAAPSAHWPRRRGRAVSRWCALSGPEAYPIAARVFQPIHRQKSVLAAKGYTALFGHYLLDGREMDETVALFYRAPHSYTGEDVIELSVHGGSAMADGLQQALIAAGAVPAGPGEFTRRALENGRMSLTQAEAVMEIISAGGQAGRRPGQDRAGRAPGQRGGGHPPGAAVAGGPPDRLDRLPGGGCARAGPRRAARHPAAAESQAGRLGWTITTRARVLRHGVDCVLLGRPNVGKSTLLNLLAGF